MAGRDGVFEEGDGVEAGVVKVGELGDARERGEVSEAGRGGTQGGVGVPGAGRGVGGSGEDKSALLRVDGKGVVFNADVGDVVEGSEMLDVQCKVGGIVLDASCGLNTDSSRDVDSAVEALVCSSNSFAVNIRARSSNFMRKQIKGVT